MVVHNQEQEHSQELVESQELVQKLVGNHEEKIPLLAFQVDETQLWLQEPAHPTRGIAFLQQLQALL